jgi:UDP-2-acetamido-3-amino-2,3-dideoxy-glucuronate N-acetyltransferase
MPKTMTENPKPYFIHPTAVVAEETCEIGAGSRIWHFSHVMAGSKMGANCTLGQNVFIATGVILGNNVKVQNNVSLYTGVTCEDDVFIGPSAVFTNVINPRSAINRRDQYRSTNIGRGATIGANATVICGNDIGNFAFVGAGSVVTKAVPEYALVMGNPAKQRGWMSEYGIKLIFDANGEAVCEESKQIYKLENGIVRRIK